MRNARLDELEAGIKIGGRNINSLRYGDDTTLMAEIEEETKSLLKRKKQESERASLKPNVEKTKIMASCHGKLVQTALMCILKVPQNLYLFIDSEYFMKSKALELEGRCYYLMAMFLQAIH